MQDDLPAKERIPVWMENDTDLASPNVLQDNQDF